MTGRRHFGSTRKLPSGRWQAGYWHNGTRHVAPRTFPAKADAQAWLSAVETDVNRGAWVDPSGGRLTVAQLASRWLASNPTKRASSRVRDDVVLRLHVLPSLGDITLASVTPAEIQALVNAWAVEHAPSTVGRQYSALRAMFTYAAASDLISRTPCPGTGGAGRHCGRRGVPPHVRD